MFQKVIFMWQSMPILALKSTPWWSYLENLKTDEKFVSKRVRLLTHQPMCHSKTCWEKKILGRHNKGISLKILRNSSLITFKIMQMQPLKKFCKKVGLNNFAILTEKHLCWRLFLIQNIAKFFRPPILKNGCFRNCSWNWES